MTKKLKFFASLPRLAFAADPVRYYDFLGEDVVEGESERSKSANNPLWLNLGFWQSVKTYPEAAEAMARLVAEAAHLSADDTLLDVGFGFGEQDFYWIERYGVKRITGLNISPMQVERTKQRAEERGLAARLDLSVGSATELPYEPSAFDKVTALECAHHFRTRERFFHEAFRVLRPGGWLALADGVPAPGHKPISLTTRLVLRHWASPIENYYDRQVYAEKLKACGFVNVTCRSIGEWVYPGMIKYCDLRRSGVPMSEAIVELTEEDVKLGAKRIVPFGINDYIIVSAQKPKGGA